MVGAGASRRVLIVEDDDAIRLLIREVLSDAGYATEEASTGREGLECARREPPAAIVLDKLMPDLDGAQFAHAYHAGPAPHAPIVALSAAADAVLWAESIGAAVALAKPLDIDDLLRAVETVIARGA